MTLHIDQALWFLVSTILTMLALLGLVRAASDAGRLSYAHPLMQLLLRWTPPRHPRLHHGRRMAFNPAAWGCTFAALLIMVILRVAILGGIYPTPAMLILEGILATVHLTLVFYIVVILFDAIMSWFSGTYSLRGIFSPLSAPILAPFRRLVPARHGFDISPLIAIMVLMTLLVLLPRG